jgi:hypothetical protein
MFWDEPGYEDEEIVKSEKSVASELLQQERDLVEVIDRITQTHHERNADLGKEDAGIGERRRRFVDELRQGAAMNLILVSAEEQEDLKIGPSDLVANLNESWALQWESFDLSKEVEFGRVDIQRIMADVSGLLHELGPVLVDNLGQDGYHDLMNRHGILEKGLLHPGRISREVARLFPRERAGEIMAWYQRLVVGLTEMKRVKELEAFSVTALGNFIMDYPGPEGDDMDDMVSIRSTGRKIGQAASDTYGSVRGRPFDASVSSVPINYPPVKPKVVTKNPMMESSGRLGYDFPTVPGSNVPMARPTANPLPYQAQGTHQLGLSKNVRDPRSYFSQGDYASASGGSDTDSGEIRGFGGMMREEILEEIGGYAEAKRS